MVWGGFLFLSQLTGSGGVSPRKGCRLHDGGDLQGEGWEVGLRGRGVLGRGSHSYDQEVGGNSGQILGALEG